jgi:hypothetical protein
MAATPCGAGCSATPESSTQVLRPASPAPETFTHTCAGDGLRLVAVTAACSLLSWPWLISRAHLSGDCSCTVLADHNHSWCRAGLPLSQIQYTLAPGDSLVTTVQSLVSINLLDFRIN